MAQHGPQLLPKGFNGGKKGFRLSVKDIAGVTERFRTLYVPWKIPTYNIMDHSLNIATASYTCTIPQHYIGNNSGLYTTYKSDDREILVSSGSCSGAPDR